MEEISDISKMLVLTLQHLDCSFFCIDALDELEPRVRATLLKALQDGFGTARVFLFLTGRPHVQSEVNRIFQGHQSTSNAINITANPDDIQAYLTHEIERDMDSNPDDMSEQLKAEILEGILSKAEGM